MRRVLPWLLAVLVCLVAGAAAAAGPPYPLEPAATVTPQATIDSLMGGVETVLRMHEEAPDSSAWSKMLRRLPGEVIDLTGVPPEFAEEEGVQTLLLLYETLSRLPPVPGPGEPGGDVPADASSWTVPHTPIALVRVASGPREGAWLVDRRALTEAYGWYERVRGLPKQPGRVVVDLVDAYSIAVGPWLGSLLPRGITSWMPDWGRVPLLGIAAWKWPAVIVLHLLVLVVTALLLRLLARVEAVPPAMRNAVAGCLMMLAAWLLRLVTIDELLIGGTVAQALVIGWILLFFIGAGMLAVVLVHGAFDLMARLGGLDDRPAARHMMQLASRLAAIAAAVWLVIVAMQLIGVPVAGIITGLGVGGVAVALAAQSTLGNLLGGVTMLLDGTIKVGDAIKYGDQTGTLEAIGLRSTRIRSLARTVVTVPNSAFAGTQIESLRHRDRMLLQTTLGLRYETTPDQMRWFLARLRALLVAHPKVDEDGAQIRLAGFGASSLDILVQAYVPTRDWNEFIAIREDVLLRIMELVARAGTGFAFPSQTLYMARDSGTDPTRTGEVEQEVQDWRDRDDLPFPDFDSGQKGEMVNTLPWPPEGSALRREHG